MPVKKTYADHGDACRTAHAMELISDHWVYIVIRELFLGGKRFGEILDSARGITPTVLTARLRELENRGILVPRDLEPPMRVRIYELTPWGHQLEPIMHALGRWAQSSPTLTTDGGLTPDAAVLAMRTMLPDAPVDPPITVQLHLTDRRGRHELAYDYVLDWGPDGFDIGRGRLDDSATRVDVDATTWADAVFDNGELPADAVTGDPEPVSRLFREVRAHPTPSAPGVALTDSRE